MARRSERHRPEERQEVGKTGRTESVMADCETPAATRRQRYCSDTQLSVVPLKYGWNKLLFFFLRLLNKKTVKGCFGDDPQIFARQKKGVPRYSDTYWNGRPQNMAENAERIDEVMLHGAYGCWRYTSAKADALVACLYEYWLCYNVDSFVRKLHYLPLPMILHRTGRKAPEGRKTAVW